MIMHSGSKVILESVTNYCSSVVNSEELTVRMIGQKAHVRSHLHICCNSPLFLYDLESRTTSWLLVVHHTATKGYVALSSCSPSRSADWI